jgi:hypothetical protein
MTSQPEYNYRLWIPLHRNSFFFVTAPIFQPHKTEYSNLIAAFPFLILLHTSSWLVLLKTDSKYLKLEHPFIVRSSVSRSTVEHPWPFFFSKVNSNPYLVYSFKGFCGKYVSPTYLNLPSL